jgi:hypothetical protein
MSQEQTKGRKGKGKMGKGISGMGRPKGTGDSQPRTRRTKAQIAAEKQAASQEPARNKSQRRNETQSQKSAAPFQVPQGNANQLPTTTATQSRQSTAMTSEKISINPAIYKELPDVVKKFITDKNKTSGEHSKADAPQTQQ